MYNSKIISFVAAAAIKIKEYSTYSGIIKAFIRLQRYFKQQSENSSILTFFRRDWKAEAVWRNSLLFIPFAFIKRISSRVAEKQNLLKQDKIEQSYILSFFRQGIKSIRSVNTRSIGIILLTGAVTEGLLWMIFRTQDMKGILLRGIFIFCAAGLIVLNRKLVLLYEGSRLLRFILHFFKVRGIDDAADLK